MQSYLLSILTLSAKKLINFISHYICIRGLRYFASILDNITLPHFTFYNNSIKMEAVDYLASCHVKNHVPPSLTPNAQVRNRCGFDQSKFKIKTNIKKGLEICG